MDGVVETNYLHHADCLSGLARLEAATVDLAFADPPSPATTHQPVASRGPAW